MIRGIPLQIPKVCFDKQAHVYSVEDCDRIPNLTGVISNVANKWIDNVNEYVLNLKREKGNNIHQICKMIGEGENMNDYDVNENTLPYVENYIRICKRLEIDFDEASLIANNKTLLVEEPLYCKKINIACTADLIEFDHNKNICKILEIKTGSTEIADLQTAGIEFIFDNIIEKNIRFKRYLIVLKGLKTDSCKLLNRITDNIIITSLFNVNNLLNERFKSV